MSQTLHWNQQEDMLWMDKDGLRLVIHPHSAKGYVRFVVIDNRDPNHCPDRLIGSGTLEDVQRQGMQPKGWQIALRPPVVMGLTCCSTYD